MALLYPLADGFFERSEVSTVETVREGFQSILRTGSRGREQGCGKETTKPKLGRASAFKIVAPSSGPDVDRYIQKDCA